MDWCGKITRYTSERKREATLFKAEVGEGVCMRVCFRGHRMSGKVYDAVPMLVAAGRERGKWRVGVTFRVLLCLHFQFGTVQTHYRSSPTPNKSRRGKCASVK